MDILNFETFIRESTGELFSGCLDEGVYTKGTYEFVSHVRLDVGEILSDEKDSVEMRVKECVEVGGVFRHLVEEI